MNTRCIPTAGSRRLRRSARASELLCALSGLGESDAGVRLGQGKSDGPVFEDPLHGLGCGD